MYSGIKQKQPKNSPSPAGRSPQRGRDGVGVSDMVDEPEFQFFTFAALTPALSHREREHIDALPCVSSLHRV